jgi:hypothetical protein
MNPLFWLAVPFAGSSLLLFSSNHHHHPSIHLSLPHSLDILSLLTKVVVAAAT